MIGDLEPDFIVIKFQHNRADYIKGLRFYLLKSKTINLLRLPLIGLMVAAVVVVSWLMGRLSLINSAVLVFAGVVILVDAVRYLRLPGQLFDGTPDLHDGVTYRFSREDFTRQDDSSAATFDWNLSELWCTNTFYYMIFSDGEYRLLPRVGFASEEDCHTFEMIAMDANPQMLVRRFELKG